MNNEITVIFSLFNHARFVKKTFLPVHCIILSSAVVGKYTLQQL
jgi:hypothetical protein